MTKGNLILTDIMFAASIIMIYYGTEGRFSLSLTLMLLIAFGNSIHRHATYFKLTRRFY